MKNTISILLLSFIFLASCSKNEDSGATTLPEREYNYIERPFNLKYEVSFSTSATTTYSDLFIKYASERNGVFLIDSAPGQIDYLQSNELNEVWSLESTITTNQTPLQIGVYSSFNPKETAEVNFKIYINNIIVENITRTVNPNPDLSINKLNGVTYFVD